MDKKKNRELLRTNEVDWILDEFDSNTKNRLRDDIGKSVNGIIDKSLSSMTLLPVVDGMIHIADEPEVVLRIETLYLLIDGLSSYIPERQVNSALRNTGHIIGRSFAYTLIDMYSDTHICTYDSFTEFWTRIDKRYGWGDIRVLDKDKMNKAPKRVEIRNSFLARENHKRCSFMEGYIRGLLDEGFRYIADELELELDMHLEPRVQVDCVTESTSNDHSCIFDVSYSPEMFKNSYHYLFQSRRNINLGEYQVFYKNLRISLEYALKELVGLKPRSRLPSHRIIQEIKKMGINVFDVSQADNLYSVCSNNLHADKSAPDKISRYFSNASVLINDICNAKIDEQVKIDIVNRIKRKADTKGS